MNIGTSIITLTIMALCLIPLLLSIRNRKNKEKKFKDNLLNFASSYECKISEFDIWSSAAIGFDQMTRKLFFIMKMGENTSETYIDIQEVQKCRVVNSNRTVKHQNSSSNVIEKLEIALTYFDKNKPAQSLEFYNCNNNGLTLNGELQLVEKWSKLINAEISIRR